MEEKMLVALQDILRNLMLWKRRKIKIKVLEGGISNINFWVKDGAHEYVARFAPKNNILLGLDREREIFNTNVAAQSGIGPRPVVFYPEHSLLIVEFILGQIFFPEFCRRADSIEKVAAVFKKLHSGKKFQGNVDLLETIQQYLFIARKRNSWLPEDIDKQFSDLRKVCSQLDKNRRSSPCHLDIMMGNLVQTPHNGVKLLDWEYSANSDYRFDLAMLSVKGEFKESEDWDLVHAYAGFCDPSLYGQIRLMKAVVYFREAAWGLLQLAISKIEFDYKKYATDNLAGFQSIAVA